MLLRNTRRTIMASAPPMSISVFNKAYCAAYITPLVVNPVEVKTLAA